MRIVSGIIAFILLVFTILNAFIPNHLYAASMYGLGAFFALVTVKKGGMGLSWAYFYAISTAALMFFYFAGFFTMAPGFEEGWHRTGAALEGFGMLLSAFMMIPILSAYSCLIKGKECDQFRDEAASKPKAFFSVPEDLKQHS